MLRRGFVPIRPGGEPVGLQVKLDTDQLEYAGRCRVPNSRHRVPAGHRRVLIGSRRVLVGHLLVLVSSYRVLASRAGVLLGQRGVPDTWHGVHRGQHALPASHGEVRIIYCCGPIGRRV